VFSRKIVAWQIYAEENGENASEVMKDLCRREKITPGQLILHWRQRRLDQGRHDARDAAGPGRHGLIESPRGQ
jgi:hypothetical protein